jgi:hypothetical protein
MWNEADEATVIGRALARATADLALEHAGR